MDLSVQNVENVSTERNVDVNLKNEVSEVEIVEEKFTREGNSSSVSNQDVSKSKSSDNRSEVMSVILGDNESNGDNGSDNESRGDKSESDEGGENGGLGKYSMPLESERGLYITGATILAMKGIITYKEYTTNQYEKHIPQDFLDKKFYLGDILGAIRGMTRLKLAMCKDRLPSVTMFNHMKKEEDELVANGCMFVTDSEESGEEEGNKKSPIKTKTLKKKITGKKTLTKPSQKKVQSKTTTSPKTTTSLPKKKVVSEKKKQVVEVKNVKNKENERSNENEDKDKELPDELLQCGDCGTSISSLQHLDRHLERCRGSKRRQSTESQSKRPKTFHSAADQLATTSGIESNQDSSIGKLYVCDTEDGEVINGWEEGMQGIPPGPTCPRCAFEVPTLYDLPLHQKFHTGSEKITCPLCPFSTNSIPVYLIHVEEHAS